MASSIPNKAFLFHLTVLISLIPFSLAARQLSSDENYSSVEYHNGPLLSGKISINLIWYGRFNPSERATILEFLTSLTTPNPRIPQPSVATWWKLVQKYYDAVKKSRKASPLALSVGTQILDEGYSVGKLLSDKQIKGLAVKGAQRDAINVVLTAADVAVEGFCSSRCGTHGSSLSSSKVVKNGKVYKYAYVWVGNSETQCPGQCAWPFHKPIYGPQTPEALVAPNNNVGVDGMIINLASLLAGTVTNPFGNGYYQGVAEAPLEAASACAGIFGPGAYPGYAGKVLVDPRSGASYNAHGAHGSKFLLPAVFDISTSSCSTLV